MFDVTARITYRDVPNWYRDITRICNDIPMVLCGNKIDVKERDVKPKTITFHRKKGMPYYEISVKSNYNYTKPFLYLLRKLGGNDKLALIAQPALPPAEVEFDEAEQRENEKAIDDAIHTGFGGDDDDF